MFAIGLQKWQQQQTAGNDPDPRARDELLGELIRDDEQTGNLQDLLLDLEALDKTSPGKVEVEKYIRDVKTKIAKQSATPAANK